MRLKTLLPSMLETLVQQNQPIYVINTSSLPSGDKGVITVNFPSNGPGSTRGFFKMPATFIPMAISDAIPSRQLVDSRDFKQCLIKGMLTLVDPNSAADALSSEEAREEYEALVLSEHSAKYKGINVESTIANRSRPKVAHQSNTGGQGPVQNIDAVDTISNKTRALVESMISKEKTPKQVLTELKRHQSALSEIDLSYVLTNATDNSLSTWIQKAINELVSGDVDEGPVAKTISKRPSRSKKAKAKKEMSSFDFSGDGEMTADEQAADAAARSAAMESQAVHGQSKANEEINKLLNR